MKQDVAISVIVPVFRDWARLPALVAALRAQSWRDFELIVVDNDPATPHDAPLPDPGVAHRVIACAAPGSYAARNAGAAQARGRWLVFTDADCAPLRDWLAGFAARFAAEPEAATILIGPVVMQAGPDPARWEIFDAVRGMPQHLFLRHGYGVTANLAVPAALFHRLGGFDASRLSGGDAEFCRRAATQGAGLALVEAATLRHPARKTRAELVTKARRIKGGQVATGPLRRRVFWTIRSLTPPLREMLAYLRASEHPLRWRLTACGVRMQLWGVELREIWRLIVLRHAPERR